MRKLYFIAAFCCCLVLPLTKAIAQNSDYIYDANGNLTQDLKRGITITYNYLNLPNNIYIKGKGTIRYVWDANGTKLKKITIDSTVSPASTTVTLYLGNAVYQNDSLLYIINPEGRTRVVGNNWVHDYFLKDHLGNVRVVITDDYNIASPILEVINYYPFGKRQAGISEVITSTLHNRHLFNGKELQEDLDLDAYDFDRRFYDPQVGRFWQQDPLADKYLDISPYVFAFDNAVRNIDPSGKSPEDVIINGKKRQDAFAQLQQSVQGYLTLTMDNSGKITYVQNTAAPTGNTIVSNASAKQLMTAIDDHSVVVNVNASDSKISSAGVRFVGGAFGGNTVMNNLILPNDAIPPTALNIVSTNQDVNPNVLKALDAAYNEPGASILHEVTESYQGGKMSQSSGVSSPNSNDPRSVYGAAHIAATPQPGTVIHQRFYDASGNVFIDNYPRQGATKVEYYVVPPNKPPVVIMTYP